LRITFFSKKIVIGLLFGFSSFKRIFAISICFRFRLYVLPVMGRWNSFQLLKLLEDSLVFWLATKTFEASIFPLLTKLFDRVFGIWMLYCVLAFRLRHVADLSRVIQLLGVCSLAWLKRWVWALNSETFGKAFFSFRAITRFIGDGLS
jgi:hypothetical protein